MKNLLLLFISLLLITSCAKTKKPPVYQKPAPVSKPAVQKAPENTAANSLIEDGVKALNENLLAKAEGLFEEAIRISPQLGIPYYWLGFVKYKMAQISKALNLLDRAEILLQSDAAWAEKINQLKYEISGAQAESSAPR